MEEKQRSTFPAISMKIKGAIFDLDGTLLDSMGVWETFGEQYLIDRGISPAPDINDILRPLTLKQSAEYLIECYGLTDSLEELMADINRKIENQYREAFTLKPGVKGFLELLDEKRIPMCIATATDRHLTELALERLGILHLIGAIFTCTEVGSGKEKPDIFLKALDFLQTELSETYVFEDAHHAIVTAKKAGFSVVGVCDNSYLSRKSEIIETADYYISSFDELGEVD